MCENNLLVKFKCAKLFIFLLLAFQNLGISTHISTIIKAYRLLHLQMLPHYSSDEQEPSCYAGNTDLTAGSGRSPGEGNDYPLHCSCLENSPYRGA